MNSNCLTIKDVTKGITARVIFGTIGLLGLLLATMITKNNWYWLLTLLIPILVAEGVWTIKDKKKFRCIVPCIVIYMLMVVPSLILMECRLDMLDTRQVDIMMSDVSNMPMTDMSNISAPSLEMYLRMKVAWLCPEDSGCKWNYVVQIYMQFFIFVLIIGSWLDPNTSLSKEQKAELILMNFGVSFDVLEFLDMTNDVRKKLMTPLIGVPFLLPTTLCVWIWSLLQFVVVFKPKYYQRTIDLSSNSCFASSKFWEVFISLILMEIPYLVFRLVMIFYFSFVNKSIIVFSAKNFLIILMQFYRLYAVQTEEHENNDSKPTKNELPLINGGKV